MKVTPTSHIYGQNQKKQSDQSTYSNKGKKKDSSSFKELLSKAIEKLNK